MSSGWPDSRRVRFDAPHTEVTGGGVLSPRIPLPMMDEDGDNLQEAISRTRRYLLSQQAPEGYWVAELEGDTILESEYILLLTFLEREQTSRAIQAAAYIRQQQLPTGGWAIYPDGPLEVSASVKAYWALKITGHDPQAEYMVRAREAIRAAGGAEKVNSFTRYYMALLGQIKYRQCPAVPPELILLPSWAPFNIYEMSAWSRTILIPLSLLWAFQPSRTLPESARIEELFLNGSAKLPVTMGKPANCDRPRKRGWIDWDGFFNQVDRGIKLLEACGMKLLRGRAIRHCADWMQQRFQHSDGLGAIFPPIIWSIVALKCLGHADDSPDLLRAHAELERLVIEEEETVRLQPCKSPVWDTAITTLALREAGVPARHPAIRNAVQWMLSKEVRQPGDWAVRNKGVEPAGWFFEFENHYYPDVDDTIMVLMALNRCLPNHDDPDWHAGPDWTSDTPRPSDRISAVIARRGTRTEVAVGEIEAIRPTLDAINRGLRWVLAMQNRDGGWGAFDVNNDRALLTRVPFADHNAMIDPSTPDITARVLEMLGRLKVPRSHPAINPALEFLWQTQETDHCWPGRWGVNYLYGTWQTLVGLTAVGVSLMDSRVRRAADWLKQTQQPNGGWGETPQSYDDPSLRGQGTPTASQTAWALLGLCSAGEFNSAAVCRGVQFLLDRQNEDGTWDEEPYTGTGFPRVFYLKYHYYRIYFPLLALSRVARLREAARV